MAASRSPLNYTGNKGCLIPQILALMPEHQTYVEPCMGSAEVFFCKPPAPLEILNDYMTPIRTGARASAMTWDILT